MHAANVQPGQDTDMHACLQVSRIVEEDRFVDPIGHALPPCIVMERGESLDLWSERNAPDRAQAFTV